MADIINLDDKRPHLSGNAKCLGCGHIWVAVAPIGTIWLECPNCSSIKGRHIYPVERSVDRWVCNCGNDLFYMSINGVYCPNCGEWQTGF